MLPGGKQPVFRLQPVPIDSQPFQQHRGQTDVAWNAAFRVANMNEHSLAVNVADLEMAQFVTAQSSGIQRGEDGPVLQVGGVIQNAGDFLRAQHDRQLQSFLDPDDVLFEPGSFEHGDVQKPERGAIQLNGAGSGLAVVDEVQEELANLLRPQLIRGSAKVLREPFYAADVEPDRLLGQIPQTQLFEHSLA